VSTFSAAVSALCGVKTGIFVIVIISSWSRSALGALLFMYMLCFCGAYSQTRGSRRLRVIVLFLLLSTLVALLYAQVIRPQYNVIRIGAGGRLYLLETASAIVEQRPIFGYGLGSYWYVGDGRNVTPHSDYLLFIVSGGIVGITFLAGFYTYWLRIALKRLMYPEALTLLVFYALEAFFNNLVRGRVSFFFWALILLVFTGSKSKCFDARESSTVSSKQAG
jgi:O-antigen ligase